MRHSPTRLRIANKGFPRCCRESRPLLCGLNMVDGHIVYDKVANAFGMKHQPA